jgi:tRNA dimethylallyltransferase
MQEQDNKLIVVTGPTATGKTAFAAHLAYRLNGEVISADSRQVYRGMDLATGKDLEDYRVEGTIVPHHLVDIHDPGYEYNVFEFQKDFLRVYKELINKECLAVLCGGTGMYIEAVVKGYRMHPVPENKTLRTKLKEKSIPDLVETLKAFKIPHNITDTEDRDRLIRAIEIQVYEKEHPSDPSSFPKLSPVVFGIWFDRPVLRQRITDRLKARLEQGMVDEVRSLLKKGLRPEQLTFYGLEYKYLTQYVVGELEYDEMVRRLNTAIHQFAKRQVTWFRKMERQGIQIHWMDGLLSMNSKIEFALKQIHT